MRHPAFIHSLHHRGGGGSGASRIIWASFLAGVLAAACGDGTSGTGSGSAGSNGATGTAGTNGGAGTTGAAGISGNAGTTGTAGSSATGTAGTTGNAGNVGTTGSAGNVGTTGNAGTTGQGAAGTTGSAGTTGGAGTAGQGGRGGTTGQAGRGGTTGTGGSTGGRGGTAGTGTAGQGGSAGGRGGTTGSAGTTGTAGTTGAGGCGNPPAQGTLVGWASLNGSTTGGGSATPQVVTTLQQFTSAVAGSTPAVIYVNGKLANGRVSIGSNKTIVGVCGGEIHGHISVNSSNVIVRNIKIVGYGVGDCSLDPNYDSSVGCSSGDDAVTIQGAQHVWFDHCDISDGTDGNLDINTGADYITISWTKFHYTPRTDPTGNDNTGAEGHRFSNLIGSADNVPQDMGHLNITWDHDWWADNVNQRMPRSRAGKIHILNSLFTATGNSYCSNAGQNAQLLVEGTVYNGVKAPFQISQNGIISAPSGSNLFTNTSGTTTGTGANFGPTYQYTVDPASGVQAAVMAGAGPH
jgi:pectate lyase